MKMKLSILALMATLVIVNHTGSRGYICIVTSAFPCRPEFMGLQFRAKDTPPSGLSAMSKQISFRDANGRRVSGCFEVSHGIITVIASDTHENGGYRRGGAWPRNPRENAPTPVASGEAIGRFKPAK